MFQIHQIEQPFWIFLNSLCSFHIQHWDSAIRGVLYFFKKWHKFVGSLLLPGCQCSISEWKPQCWRTTKARELSTSSSRPFLSVFKPGSTIENLVNTLKLANITLVTDCLLRLFLVTFSWLLTNVNRSQLDHYFKIGIFVQVSSKMLSFIRNHSHHILRKLKL